MQIYIFTLFPEMFNGFFSESILKRAIAGRYVQIHLINFRDFALDKHKTVDDSPFGGGAGMLLKAEPIFLAMESIANSDEVPKREKIVMMSPQGKVFQQNMANEFSQLDRLILLCGHYEGFDDRVRQHLVTDEVSLGDFVLTGGEVAAMAIADAVIRLLPGVLGNEHSTLEESHASGLLEYPQYTRPADFRGSMVPQTLLSGNHAEIKKWRDCHALYRTWRRRPDLLQGQVFTAQQKDWLRAFERGDFDGIDVLD